MVLYHVEHVRPTCVAQPLREGSYNFRLGQSHADKRFE